MSLFIKCKNKISLQMHKKLLFMLKIMLICYAFDVSMSMTCHKVHKKEKILILLLKKPKGCYEIFHFSP